ncbi:MAG: hypothetical protein H6Q14_3018 [Bacteroidetes bacterium]|jgi:hypothetical protein|nr:hypothetical protein [Bacteroidota bacterium]
MKQFFRILSFLSFSFLILSCSSNKKADEELKNIANSYNAHCPMKISDDTQLDSVYSLPNKILVYKYTLALLDPASFDKNQFEEDRKSFIANGIKSAEDMAYLRKLKVVFYYEYYGTKGEILAKIVVLPKDYE